MSSTIPLAASGLPVLSPRLSALVAEVVARLSARGYDLDAPARMGTARVALGMAIHRSHGVTALRAADRAAWRTYSRHESLAEAAVRRERPHTVRSTQMAVDQANDRWPAARDAAVAVREAEGLSAADRERVFALLAALSAGSTWRTLLDTLTAAVGPQSGGAR
ncbi:hypothetical protein [Streptomyces sp. 184]|uniref:hypothetical protein n=1 Tax=Streptomyces sp. 184 TaxID=1827526 RepID=UPI003891F00C